MDDYLANRFTHHPPKDGQHLVYGNMRQRARELAEFIERWMPGGRDKALAITKLEEAVMWANAALARGGMRPENIEACAARCHEVNRVYCETIGDTSQASWASAEQWQRDSAIKGVLFYLNNTESTPESMHESWMATKAADGWTYGEAKDPDRKTHPCMVDYSQLPEEHRIKDVLFINTIRDFFGLGPIKSDVVVPDEVRQEMATRMGLQLRGIGEQIVKLKKREAAALAISGGREAHRAKQEERPKHDAPRPPTRRIDG